MAPDPVVAILNQHPPDISIVQFKLLNYHRPEQTVGDAYKTQTFSLLEVKNCVTRAMIHGKSKAILHDYIPKYTKIWTLWIGKFHPANFDSSLLEP